MCITEYDEVRTMEMFKDEGRAEERKAVYERLINMNFSEEQAQKIAYGEENSQTISNPENKDIGNLI